MRSEMFYPDALRSNAGLSAVLTMCLFQNMGAGILGRAKTPPECLKRDAWDQAGYCIDAPECMPAGAVMRVSIGYDLGDAGEQVTFDRAA